MQGLQKTIGYQFYHFFNQAKKIFMFIGNAAESSDNRLANFKFVINLGLYFFFNFIELGVNKNLIYAAV